jgi:soluble lytic murein transglycosylase-like protein
MVVNLATADRVVAASSSPPGQSVTDGDGDIAATAGLDTWHGAFSVRLDESIAKLRQEKETVQRSPVIVASRRAPEAESQPTLPTSFAENEKQDRFPLVASILRENGLPPNLTGVVAVESGFNPLALSRKGARGLWQLMPATARRYGLIVEPRLDERIDPLKSTQAAAAYMKDLFAQFQDWPLALAAYNAGEARVARALARTGARDFWTLRRHAALPEETLRYVPVVLAKLENPPVSHKPGVVFSLTYAPTSRGPILYARTAPLRKEAAERLSSPPHSESLLRVLEVERLSEFFLIDE